MRAERPAHYSTFGPVYLLPGLALPPPPAKLSEPSPRAQEWAGYLVSLSWPCISALCPMLPSALSPMLILSGACVAPSTSEAVGAFPSRPRMGWLPGISFLALYLCPLPYAALCSEPYADSFWGLRCPLHQRSCRSLPLAPKNGLVILGPHLSLVSLSSLPSAQRPMLLFTGACVSPLFIPVKSFYCSPA